MKCGAYLRNQIRMELASRTGEKLNIPSRNDDRWYRIIDGTHNPALRTLATRLLVTRLRLDVKNHLTSLSQAADALHNFFVENPFSHRDLDVI